MWELSTIPRLGRTANCWWWRRLHLTTCFSLAIVLLAGCSSSGCHVKLTQLSLTSESAMARSVLMVVVGSIYYILECHCSLVTSLLCLLAGLNMMSAPHLSALNWAQECWSLTASGSKWAVVVVVVVGWETRPDCLPGRDLNTSIHQLQLPTILWQISPGQHQHSWTSGKQKAISYQFIFSQFKTRSFQNYCLLTIICVKFEI